MTSERSATADPDVSGPMRLEPLLGDVLSALTGTDRLAEALQRCAQAVVDRLDAAFARIWGVDETTGNLQLLASAGLYTHLDGAHSRVPIGSLKIGWIALERRPHLSNDVSTNPRISDPEWARTEGMVSFAGYPLLVQGRVVGVLALFARHELGPETLDALSSVASSIALGMARWRTEAQLRDENRILENLYRLGTAIIADLDVERVVQSVTEAATDLCGAQYGAYLSGLTGSADEASMYYGVAGASSDRVDGFPLPRNPALLEPTFRGERVLRLDDVLATEEFPSDPGTDPGSAAGDVPVRSYLAVPVVARNGEVLGGLFFGHCAPGMFSERDERIVRGIAGHAAVAIENARMYEREHRAALALQQSLLPEALPELAGTKLAGRYVPASRYADVGGDWYDGVLLGDGRLVLSVGDVLGHDLRAAAVMGQVRTAARAYAIETSDPVQIIARLDRFMIEAGFGEFATTMQISYDPATRAIEAMSAGHLPPLLLVPDEPTKYLEMVPLPPVGLGLVEPSTAGATPSRAVLTPGSTLVLYTDGLVERPGETLDEGLERLRTVAGRLGGLDVDALCDRLVDELAGGRRDDVAVVAFQI